MARNRKSGSLGSTLVAAVVGALLLAVVWVVSSHNGVIDTLNRALGLEIPRAPVEVSGDGTTIDDLLPDSLSGGGGAGDSAGAWHRDDPEMRSPTAVPTEPTGGHDAGSGGRLSWWERLRGTEHPEPAAVPSTDRDAPAGLDAVEIAAPAPAAGYDREDFGPAWTDEQGAELGGNGCGTRNDILTRDLTVTSTVATPDCPHAVATGVLHDPYTGATVEFTRGDGTSTSVQVDHIVPLAYAYRHGADQWHHERRVEFANDPENLAAVDGPTNSAKGDAGPADWMPPHAAASRCGYATSFTHVALAYGVSVTAADEAALAEALATC